MLKNQILVMCALLLLFAVPMTFGSFSGDTPNDGEEFEFDELVNVSVQIAASDLPKSDLFLNFQGNSLFSIDLFPSDIYLHRSDNDFLMKNSLPVSSDNISSNENLLNIGGSLNFDSVINNSFMINVDSCDTGDLVFSINESVWAVCNSSDLSIYTITNETEHFWVNFDYDLGQDLIISFYQDDFYLKSSSNPVGFQFESARNICFSGGCKDGFDNDLVLNDYILLYKDLNINNDSKTFQADNAFEKLKSFNLTQSSISYSDQVNIENDENILSLLIDGQENNRTFYGPEGISWKKDLDNTYNVYRGEDIEINLTEYVNLSNHINYSSLGNFEIKVNHDLFLSSIVQSLNESPILYIGTGDVGGGSYDLILNATEGITSDLSNEFRVIVGEDEFLQISDSSSPKNSSNDFIYAKVESSSHFEITDLVLSDSNGPIGSVSTSSHNFTDLNPGNYTLSVEAIKGDDSLYELDENFRLYPPLAKREGYNVSNYLWEDEVLATNIYRFTQVFQGGVPGEMQVSILSSSMDYNLIENNTDIFLVKNGNFHINHTARFYAEDGFTSATSNSFWLNSSLDNISNYGGSGETEFLDVNSNIQLFGHFLRDDDFNISTNMAASKLLLTGDSTLKNVTVDFRQINPASLGLGDKGVFKAYDLNYENNGSSVELDSFIFSVPLSWFDEFGGSSSDVFVYREDEWDDSMSVEVLETNDTHRSYVSDGVEGRFIIGVSPFDFLESKETEDSNQDSEADEGGDESTNSNDDSSDFGGDFGDEGVNNEDVSDSESSQTLIIGFIIAIVLSFVIGFGAYYYYHYMRLNLPKNNLANNTHSPMAKVSLLANKVDRAIKEGRSGAVNSLLDEMKNEALKVPQNDSAVRKMLFDKVNSLQERAKSMKGHN